MCVPGLTARACLCSACRHGDRCSRHHNKPNLSCTILLPNLYQNPSLNAPLGPDGLPIVVDGKYVQDDYEVRPCPGGTPTSPHKRRPVLKEAAP